MTCPHCQTSEPIYESSCPGCEARALDSINQGAEMNKPEAANVERLPLRRHDLQRLVDEIKAVVYERKGQISVIEAIGALELVKLEIFEEQS